MDIKFGYQYVDFNPDHVERVDGNVDLEKAIRLYQSFPWDEQFAKASDREDSNITSIVPGIYFYKSEKLFLSIYAQDNYGFWVRYEKGNCVGNLFLSNNIFEKPHRLSVERVIEFFYTDRLEELIDLFTKEDNEPKGRHTFRLKYSKNKIFRPLLFLLLPLALLFYQPSQRYVWFYLEYGKL